jgi:uncharacterized protein
MKFDPTMLRIDKKVIKARRLEGLIILFFYIVVVVILLVLSKKINWPLWIVPTAIAWTVLSIPFEIYIFPHMKYEMWSYYIHEDEIELHHGFIFRKKTTIPMVKIQHIDLKHGPILKHYGLATITFSTAAGSHEIPGLTEEVAEELRNKISTLARLSNEETQHI